MGNEMPDNWKKYNGDRKLSQLEVAKRNISINKIDEFLIENGITDDDVSIQEYTDHPDRASFLGVVTKESHHKNNQLFCIGYEYDQ